MILQPECVIEMLNGMTVSVKLNGDDIKTAVNVIRIGLYQIGCGDFPHLPLFPDIREEEQQYVVRVVRDLCARHAVDG